MESDKMKSKQSSENIPVELDNWKSKQFTEEITNHFTFQRIDDDDGFIALQEIQSRVELQPSEEEPPEDQVLQSYISTSVKLVLGRREAIPGDIDTNNTPALDNNTTSVEDSDPAAGDNSTSSVEDSDPAAGDNSTSSVEDSDPAARDNSTSSVEDSDPAARDNSTSGVEDSDPAAGDSSTSGVEDSYPGDNNTPAILGGSTAALDNHAPAVATAEDGDTAVEDNNTSAAENDDPSAKDSSSFIVVRALKNIPAGTYFLLLLLLLLYNTGRVVVTNPVNVVVIATVMLPGVGGGDQIYQYCYQRGPCGRGQLFQVWNNSCSPCPYGTWSDMGSHNCTSCKQCTRGNSRKWQIEVTPCNATSDTKLGCKDGYEDISAKEGNNQPDCRPKLRKITTVFETPSSRDNVTPEFSLPSTTDSYRSNQTNGTATVHTGSDLLPLWIVLSVIVLIVCVIVYRKRARIYKWIPSHKTCGTKKDNNEYMMR